MLIFSIFLYLLFTLIIGKFASKYVKTSADFAIAGRSMPTYVVASGLFATWFGSETIMGATSEFIENGILGVIEDPFGAALCLFLLGIFFVRPLYKLDIITFSDYFNLRYDRNVEIISAFFMIPSYFGWIAAQLVAMAIILEVVVGIPFLYGIIICAFVVLVYTYLGGMWSVSITDTIQTVIIILGLILIAFLFYQKIPSLRLVVRSLPKNFFQFTPKNTLHDWLLYFSAWITIGWGSIPQQDVFQRILSAKTMQTAVNGAIISAFLYLTIALIPLFIVIVGHYLYPAEVNENAQLFIPHLILNHTPLYVQIIFFGALLSAILSTCSGAILAPATVIAENIMKPIYGNSISDAFLLKLMRFSVIGIAIVSVFLASYKSNIYELVGESSALSLVALFVPLVAGIYWKRASTLGAILSMIFGTLAWIFFDFMMESELSMLYGFGVSCFGMVVGSLLKPSALKPELRAKLPSMPPEN